MITAMCKDHTLRLGCPCSPTPSRTHRTCPDKTWHRGRKEGWRMMRSLALSSLGFLSPSSWLFHRTSLPIDPSTGVSIPYKSAFRAQIAGSKQNVLAAGPHCPGATDNQADKRAEQTPPPPKETEEVVHAGREGVPSQGPAPGRRLEFPEGATSG